jgi:hypothetical protein
VAKSVKSTLDFVKSKRIGARYKVQGERGKTTQYLEPETLHL